MILCIRDSGRLATFAEDQTLAVCVTCGERYLVELLLESDETVWDSLRLTGRYEDDDRVITVDPSGEALVLHEIRKAHA